MGNFPSSLYRMIYYTVGSLYRAPTVYLSKPRYQEGQVSE